MHSCIDKTSGIVAALLACASVAWCTPGHGQPPPTGSHAPPDTLNAPAEINVPGQHRVITEELRPIRTSVEPSYTVQRVGIQPPQIDGKLDEWSGVDAITLKGAQYVKGDGKWNGADDSSGSLKMLWDQRGVYFALEVTDDVVNEPAKDAEDWTNDCCQIVFDTLLNGPFNSREDQDYNFWQQGSKYCFDSQDLSYCATRTAAGPALTHYRVRGLPVESRGTLPDKSIRFARINDAYSDTKRAYAYEWFLPWERLTPVSPSILGKCGFSFTINDNDDKGFKSALAWTDGAIYGLQPGKFGQLAFEGAVGSRDEVLELPPEGTTTFARPVSAEADSSRPAASTRGSKWLDIPGVESVNTARMIVRATADTLVDATLRIKQAGDGTAIGAFKRSHAVRAGELVAFVWDLSKLPAGQYQITYENSLLKSSPASPVFTYTAVGTHAGVPIPTVPAGARPIPQDIGPIVQPPSPSSGAPPSRPLRQPATYIRVPQRYAQAGITVPVTHLVIHGEIKPLRAAAEPVYRVKHAKDAPKVVADWVGVPAIKLAEESQVRYGLWEGPSDLSGSLAMQWTVKGVYFRMVVRDNVQGKPKDDAEDWTSECAKFGFDSLLNGPPFKSADAGGCEDCTFDSQDFSYALIRRPELSPLNRYFGPVQKNYRIKYPSQPDVKPPGEIPPTHVVDGSDSYRVYQWFLSWENLAPVSPSILGRCGFNFALNDDDGEGLQSAMSWTDDAVDGMRAHKFGQLVFEGAIGSRDDAVVLPPEPPPAERGLTMPPSEYLDIPGTTPTSTVRLLMRAKTREVVKVAIRLTGGAIQGAPLRLYYNYTYTLEPNQLVAFIWDLSHLPRGNYEVYVENSLAPMGIGSMPFQYVSNNGSALPPPAASAQSHAHEDLFPHGNYQGHTPGHFDPTVVRPSGLSVVILLLALIGLVALVVRSGSAVAVLKIGLVLVVVFVAITVLYWSRSAIMVIFAIALLALVALVIRSGSAVAVLKIGLVLGCVFVVMAVIFWSLKAIRVVEVPATELSPPPETAPGGDHYADVHKERISLPAPPVESHAAAESAPKKRTPASPPEWLETKPGLSDDTYRTVVSSGRWMTRQECDDALRQAMAKATSRYIDQYLESSDSGDSAIDTAAIVPRVKTQEHVERVSTSLGPMLQTYALLEFDHGVRALLRSQWREARVGQRIRYSTAGMLGVLLLLSAAYGYLTLSPLARTRHRGQLKLSAALVILLTLGSVVLVQWANLP